MLCVVCVLDAHRWAAPQPWAHLVHVEVKCKASVRHFPAPSVIATMFSTAVRTLRATRPGALRASLRRADEFTNPNSTRAAQATYHPGGYGVSQGMRRARQRYNVSNFFMIMALFGVIGGIYAYSILAVEQEDFSDLENIRFEDSDEGRSEAARSQGSELPPLKVANSVAQNVTGDNSPSTETKPAPSNNAVAAAAAAAKLGSGPAMNKHAI